jgi:hypothetical protein
MLCMLAPWRVHFGAASPGIQRQEVATSKTPKPSGFKLEVSQTS